MHRLIQLCKNSVAIPPCPLRSRPGISASDLSLQVRPQLSKNEYETTLLDLPRPGKYESAARGSQHWNSIVGKFVGVLYHCLLADHLFLDIEKISCIFRSFPVCNNNIHITAIALYCHRPRICTRNYGLSYFH